MKVIPLLIFFAVTTTVQSQDKPLTKRTLYKTFKESIRQEEKHRLSTLSNPWKANNDDSIYFKSDTIEFTNFHKRNSVTEFCASINWSFYRKDKFFRVHERDGLARAYSDSPEFKISIIMDKRDILIQTWNITTGVPVLSDRFKVIELSKDTTSSTLTIVRVK